jgi:galactose-1-phosphate uridylyltransferase
MPELRQEPITGNWVIIATERNKRPSDFPARHEERKGGTCPFCKGNEKLTPPEITAYRTNLAGGSGLSPINIRPWIARARTWRSGTTFTRA